jgi:hypothetical protein
MSVRERCRQIVHSDVYSSIILLEEQDDRSGRSKIMDDRSDLRSCTPKCRTKFYLLNFGHSENGGFLELSGIKSVKPENWYIL